MDRDHPQARAKVLIGLAGMAGMLFNIDRNVLAALKTTIAPEFGWSDADYGLLTAVLLLAYIASYFATSGLIDRWGTRRSMPLFVAGMSTATLLSGLARTDGEMVLARLLLGAAQAGIQPATILAIVTWFPVAHRGTANAFTKPFTVAGHVLLPVFVAGVTAALGWRWAFLIPALIGFVVAALWWLCDREPAKTVQVSPRFSLREVLSWRAVWLLAAVRAVSDPVWFFLGAWQPAYLQEHHGMSLAEYGRLGWIPPALSLLGTMMLGALSDRFIVRGADAITARRRALNWSLLAVPALFGLFLTRDYRVALGLLALIQIMTSTWLGLTGLLMSDLVPRHAVATAVGVISAVGAAAGALANFAAGHLVPWAGYPVLLGLCGVLHPLAALLLWRGIKHLKPVTAGGAGAGPETAARDR